MKKCRNHEPSIIQQARNETKEYIGRWWSYPCRSRYGNPDGICFQWKIWRLQLGTQVVDDDLASNISELALEESIEIEDDANLSDVRSEDGNVTEAIEQGHHASKAPLEMTGQVSDTVLFRVESSHGFMFA